MQQKNRYIIALDQGTTSSRALLLDHDVNILATAQHPIQPFYPQNGWVEQDPMEIYATQSATLIEAMTKAGVQSEQIAAIGITNQRETTIVWHKKTGKPIYNAIGWQCRRSAPICDELKKQGLAPYVKESTGLVIDPYFSATKIKWILDNVKGARDLAEKGLLLFGTVDSWLVWNMTQRQVHVTDPTNASRTMLFNINTLKWDDKLLKALSIPASMMPKVQSSSEIYGWINIGGKGNNAIPIAGIAGDQQAALFGQLCVEKGQTKNTYGTGCFLLMNTGKKKITSENNLLTTLACNAKGEVSYALEGAVFMGGASIQWLRDEMGLIKNAEESEIRANEVANCNGVYVVPAFTGLGAPHWDPYARGTIMGITRNVNANHIIRATLESIAYQSVDVLTAMEADSKVKIRTLKVDGGAVGNDFLMQFQSDILNARVQRPKITETTALGAAFLAGLAVHYWQNLNEVKSKLSIENTFSPSANDKKRQERYKGWLRAIEHAKGWSQIDQSQ